MVMLKNSRQNLCSQSNKQTNKLLFFNIKKKIKAPKAKGAGVKATYFMSKTVSICGSKFVFYVGSFRC